MSDSIQRSVIGLRAITKRGSCGVCMKLIFSSARNHRHAVSTAATFIAVLCLSGPAGLQTGCGSAFAQSHDDIARNANKSHRVYVVPFQRANGKISQLSIYRVEASLKTLMSMNSSLDLIDAPNTQPAPRGPRVASPKALGKLVKLGSLTGNFRGQAARFSKGWKLDFLVMGFIVRDGDKFKLATFMYSAARKQVAQVAVTQFSRSLTGLQAKLVNVEQMVANAVTNFPLRHIVRRRPDIYSPPSERRPPPVTPRPTPRTAPIPPPRSPDSTTSSKTSPPPIYRRQPDFRGPPEKIPGPIYKPTDEKPATQPVRVKPLPRPLVRENAPFVTLDRDMSGLELNESFDSEPLYKKWWLWTAVGAVVVGGVVTAILLSTDPDAGAPAGWSVKARWE